MTLSGTARAKLPNGLRAYGISYGTRWSWSEDGELIADGGDAAAAALLTSREDHRSGLRKPQL